MMARIKVTHIYNIFILLIIVFSVIIFPKSVFSEQYFHLEYIDQDHGLEDSSVVKIIQDNDGYMWFGTYDGLYKYDGRKARKYSNDGKVGSLLSDDINDILLTKNNNLWVATNTSGVAYLDRNSDFFTHYTEKTTPNNLHHYKVRKLIEFDQKIWILTESGIDSINQENHKFSRAYFKNSIGDKSENFSARSLVVFNGRLLTLIENKIYSLNLGENIFELLSFDDYKKYSYSTTSEHYNLFSGDDNNLFVYTSDGLFKVNSDSKLIDKELLSISQIKTERQLIEDVIIDRYKTIWVATLGHGVYYKLTTEKKYQKIPVGAGKYQLNTDQVFRIYQDLTNNIWIGTDGYYAAKLRTPQHVFPFFSNFYEPNRADHTNTVWTFEEFMGEIYIGTDNGVFLITEPGTTIKPFITNEKYRLTYDLLSTKKEMYIGGLNGLHSMLPNGVIQNYNHLIAKAAQNNITSDNTVSQLAQSESHLFVGTFNGLISIDKINNNTTYYNHKNGDYEIHNGAIMALAYDNKENLLWLGSETGIEVISTTFNKKVKIISDILKKINGYVNDIHIDQLGNVWIAVDTTLYRFTPEYALLEYKHFPENEIRSIETVDNFIWMTTPSGMIKASIDNLEDFVYYIKEDGLYNTANTTMASMYLESKDELYFGGDKGFVKFNSKINIPVKEAIAPIMNVVRLMNVVNQPNILERLQNSENLKYFENNLRFEFAHLDFKAPKKTKFHYQLDGFDKNWSSLSNENHASYTNLKSGDYIFRVKVYDANNVLSDKELSIHFKIEKAWWKSDFAYFLYFSIFLFATLFMMRWFKTDQVRIKNLQVQRNKEEFISGYNRYALSLTELQSHQTLVRKFLDQIKIITGSEFIQYKQFLMDDVLDISIGHSDKENLSSSEMELTTKDAIAQLYLQRKNSGTLEAVSADLQILFQQMVILQNALLDKQKYNWNDYFSSVTGLYNIVTFKNIMNDEIERAEMNGLSLNFYEWTIDKKQFRENELLKRIQLLSYGDKIKDVFGAHVIATFSENFDKASKFIIFLASENLENNLQYKLDFEEFIKEIFSVDHGMKSEYLKLRAIKLYSEFNDYIKAL